MNIFAAIEKLINEHGSAAILKERLSLAADQFKKLEEENGLLKHEKASLEDELGRLRTQLKATLIPQEFVESRGVLFKRLNDGKIAPDAYCPTCKTVLFSLQGVLPLNCSKCGFAAHLTGKEIPKVIAGL